MSGSVVVRLAVVSAGMAAVRGITAAIVSAGPPVVALGAFGAASVIARAWAAVAARAASLAIDLHVARQQP